MDDDDEIVRVICIDVTDRRPPVKGSKVHRCHRCRTSVWLSPELMPAVADGAETWCLPCVEEEGTLSVGSLELTPGQMEVASRLGMTEQEVLDALEALFRVLRRKSN